MNSGPEDVAGVALVAVAAPGLPILPIAPALPARLLLPPKGACWYCDKPLDSVRRFCGRDCAGAFDEEAAYQQQAL